MSNISIKTAQDGLSGSIDFNDIPKVTVNAAGIKTVKDVQIGESATALNNLVIKTDNAGSASIEQGILGGVGNRNILSVDNSGKASFANPVSVPAATASGDAVQLGQLSVGTVFSPNIGGTTTAGTPTYTANGNVGRYSKIGDRCFCTVFLDWTNLVGAAGTLAIRDLPFASANIANLYCSVSIGYPNSIAMNPGHIAVGIINPNDNKVILYQTPVGGGASTGIPLDAFGTLIVTFEYFV